MRVLHVFILCLLVLEVWKNSEPTSGLLSKNLQSSSKLEPPCRSCFISQHSHGCLWPVHEAYIITLFFEVNFNCHWQFAFRHCVLILHQKAVFTRVIRTWKLWIFLYVVPGLAHITAVIGVIVTLSNYFLWMSSGIFYYSAAMFLRCSYRLARQFHNSSNLCSNHHKQPSNALAII